MPQLLGTNILDLRIRLNLNQSDFGKMLTTSAMTISRWERDNVKPPSGALLKLGIAAKKEGLNGWPFWEAAGLSRSDARKAIHL